MRQACHVEIRCDLVCFPPSPWLGLVKHRVWRSAAQSLEKDLSPCLRGEPCRIPEGCDMLARGHSWFRLLQAATKSWSLHDYQSTHCFFG